MSGGIPVWRHVGATPIARTADRAPVVIVGGGPVGLAMALDLGRRGHHVIVLNKLDFVAAGSKAICFAKRSLEIFDRLGVGDAMVEKGVIWNTGKVFRGADPMPIYSFDLLPVKDQKRPAFINIQQYHVEDRLIAALEALPNVELRWGHEAIDLTRDADGATATVRAGGDSYTIRSDWLIACDGSKSRVRELMGLDFEGRIFEDNFLIADIRLKSDRPAERWFWFDPPFSPGQSALLHKQPDDVWRLDFQLGWNVDRAACIRPENVAPLVRGMLGEDIDFDPVWYSVYTFQCRRMARFVHGRVIFAGDAAHLVSPFGARGCNGGLADVANLGWKLDLVLRGVSPERLIESYNIEATAIADENILRSSQATDFMTPKDAGATALRDAVLDLARDHAFARQWVNSGRLSTAISVPDSSLNTDDVDEGWAGGVAPGSPMIDAPLGSGWLLDALGDGFSLLHHDARLPAMSAINVGEAPAVAARFDLEPGSACLVRPDHYVAARWRSLDAAKLQAALDRATGLHP